MDPFFSAITANDTAAVAAILDADPSRLTARLATPDKDGNIPPARSRPTALQTAAVAGHLPMIELLLARGASPDEPAQHGYPAVVHAIWARQTAATEVLLRAGRECKLPPFFGLGISLHDAARENLLDLVRAHIAQDPLAVHRRGLIGDATLHWPAHNGHVEVVRALLDAGADIEADAIGLYGGKPLHWAAEHAPAVVELLLSRGAAVNSRNILPGDYLGFTPLIMCAAQQNDCVDCARILLAAGADPAATDAQGRDIPWWSAKRNSPKVAALVAEARRR